MPFNFLPPFGFICRFPPLGLSTTSCLYAVSIYEFLLRPCAAQQLPAGIWFQYLGFSCLSTTSCAHLVSISNFPPCASHQTSLTSCVHWASISILSRECSAHLLVTHWVSHLLPVLPSSSQFLLFTPLCPTWEYSPGFNIWTSPPPCASHHFFAFIRLVSRLHLWPLNNFLHASQVGFNV